MGDIFKYLPYIIKLSEHQSEITELTNLLGPTFAEFNKVKAKVIPLVVKLYTGLTN